MNLKIAIILMFFGPNLFGQNKPITYRNTTNAFYGKVESKDTFFAPTINEITLNTDSTFEFWSRPNVSCFTWNEYKGTWKRIYDTIFFYNTYEIIENDTRVTYKNDTNKSYRIRFRTDSNSELKNTKIKVEYVYDFDAHLEDSEKEFMLTTQKLLEIPFDNIPNLNKLAAIRIECQLNNIGKRYAYLTENKTVNIRQNDIPNIIEVEFVENPKKEAVRRTIKSKMQNDSLIIVSSTKTLTTLPDYYREILFEDFYKLDK